MTPLDILGLVLLGSAASLGLALLVGGLLAFGDEPLDLEADELPSEAAEARSEHRGQEHAVSAERHARPRLVPPPR